MANIPHQSSTSLVSPFLPSSPLPPPLSSSPSPPSLGLSRSYTACPLSQLQVIAIQEPTIPTNNKLRVVLSASTTSGHIIPTVAIADELKPSNPNTEILLKGTPWRTPPSLLQATLSLPSLISTIEYFPNKHKCAMTGNPVRGSLRQFVSKVVMRLEFFPQFGEEAKVILVLGGSLGANAINIAVLNMYSQMMLEHKNWYIIWKFGVESYNEMEILVQNGSNLVLKPFLQPMNLAYAAADHIVSRAGAMTCSEILAIGKPAIMIPSPDAAEGHQLRTASLMADVAGSRVITEDELDSTTLGAVIEEILGDDALREEMSENALKVANPDASSRITQLILLLVESTSTK